MHLKLLDDVYLVGGQDMHLVYMDWIDNDSSVYLVDTGDTLVLVDCGCGESLGVIMNNIKEAEFDLDDISHLILTSAQYPHAGAAEAVRRMGVEIIASEAAAKALESADLLATGAFRYGRTAVGAEVNHVAEDDEIVTIGRYDFRLLMLPGASAGAIGVLFEIENKVTLFSGDTVLPPVYGPVVARIDYNLREEIASLERLLAEDPEVILPGHGFPCFQHGRAWIESRLTELLERYQLRRTYEDEKPLG